ncbi:MAG TPA: Crp/Fnr family transcriptional regulator, partial [Saprospirales bacterium]|nr:Crp/Fnr family transcriptional regulator [Saprospirales bacterium]
MIGSFKRKEIEKLLRAYFPQLSQEQLVEEISEFGEITGKDGGEMVIDFGAYVHFLPLVIKGSLKISRMNAAGEEIFLYFVGPGDTCASSFSCCMTQKKSLLKAEAEEDVSFISVPLKYADLWMSRYPQWRNFVVQMYDKRLMELIETLDAIAFSRMD